MYILLTLLVRHNQERCKELVIGNQPWSKPWEENKRNQVWHGE